MILTGPLIDSSIDRGEIRVDPYEPSHLNPASLDLRLGRCVVEYADGYLDSRESQPTISHQIDDEGFLVLPGRLYLMHTLEKVWTERFVPIVDGKSSIGRLGVGVHVTAGYGDPGFDGQYTLEVFSIGHAVRLYPLMRIAQIRFHRTMGSRKPYRGNYVSGKARGAVPSQCWRQFETNERCNVETKKVKKR